MVAKIPYEDVVSYLESVGYKILITKDKYKGIGKSILSLCPSGHETEVYIKDMKKNGGKYCKKCFIEDKKVPYSEVLDFLSSIGYKSLITEKEYRGIKYPFRGECKNGHICEKLLIGDLKNGNSCCVTCGNMKRTETFIEKYGVSNPMHVKEFKDKRDETNLERYGTLYPSQSKEVKEKINQTHLERYGVIRSTQLQEFKDKRDETNLERYGTIHPSQLEEFKEKTKQTNLERFGFTHPMKSEEFKERVKQTNIKKYGVPYVAQNREIHSKMKKSLYSRKEYIFPSGKKILCQGYEPFCLDDLIKEGYEESEIITEEVPIISYEYTNVQRKYFPDIFIPTKNLIIEVKSLHTFEINKEKNLLKAKACKESGYNFEFRIYDGKGKIIENNKIIFQ